MRYKSSSSQAPRGPSGGA